MHSWYNFVGHLARPWPAVVRGGMPRLGIVGVCLPAGSVQRYGRCMRLRRGVTVEQAVGPWTGNSGSIY